MPQDPPEAGTEPLATTPLDSLHRALGARMVPFAGYAMPVQYPAGILKEHTATRTSAGLFDVSHMGQARLVGEGAAAFLEKLVPGDILGLAEGRIRYTQFTDDDGGIFDDLMATRTSWGVFLVVNAACKVDDFARIRAALPRGISLETLDGRGLMALQGPKAEEIMARLAPALVDQPFMSSRTASIRGITVEASRSGYTGEDGWEISVEGARAEDLAKLLLDQPEVLPVGLGARDSLRLEAGLCLYGHDIDRTTSPIEAGLSWSIGKRRRAEGGFPGAARIQRELRDGPSRLRVGIRPDGRQPVREGAEIVDASGAVAGRITSGGFAPTLGAPIAMGYVPTVLATPGTVLGLVVRDRTLSAQVAAMPFVPNRYKRP